jgi:hypothetical protein
MTISSDCWMGTGGIASAEHAKPRAKATAINLIITSSLDEASRADFEDPGQAYSPHNTA